MTGAAHHWERIDWARAAPELAALMPDQLSAAADAITGRVQCYRITGPGYAGTLALQVRVHQDGTRELYLEAGRGHGMARVIEVAQSIARANGCSVIGAHSSRPGYPRFAARLGFVEVERYYRKAVQ